MYWISQTSPAIALMAWPDWTGFAMLVGAELNPELAKVSREGKIDEKHELPDYEDRLCCLMHPVLIPGHRRGSSEDLCPFRWHVEQQLTANRG